MNIKDNYVTLFCACVYAHTWFQQSNSRDSVTNFYGFLYQCLIQQTRLHALHYSVVITLAHPNPLKESF